MAQVKKMKEELISSSSSVDSEEENDLHHFTINEHYAKAFQYRKEREELVKRACHHAPVFTRRISLTFLSRSAVCSQREVRLRC